MLAVSWKTECYLDSRGNNPVERFIESLPVDDRASLRARIDFFGQIGNRAREPISKSLGSGLFELRAKASRVFYCFKPNGVIVLLHGSLRRAKRHPVEKWNWR
jgi:phage-related protein